MSFKDGEYFSNDYVWFLGLFCIGGLKQNLDPGNCNGNLRRKNLREKRMPII